MLRSQAAFVTTGHYPTTKQPGIFDLNVPFTTRDKLTKSKHKAKTAGSAWVYLLVGLFGLPFAIVGVATTLSLFRSSYHEIGMQYWTEVPCSIISSALKDEPGDESRIVRVVASYTYRVDNRDYVGSRVTVSESASSNIAFHTNLQSMLADHQASGQPFRCFVNPNSPEQSILFRDFQWQYTAMQTWMALVFLAIGLGLLAAVAASWVQDGKTPSKVEGQKKPWLRREDWAKGEIRYSGRNAGQVTLWIGVAIFVISIPGLITSLQALIYRQDLMALWGLIASAIGLWVAGAGFRQQIRHRRYGKSIFQMASVPGVLGGTLAGVIRTEARIDSPAGFRFNLCCTETTASTDSDSGSTIETLWEEEQTIVKQMESPDREGTAVPVMFVLPYDAPQSRDEPGSDPRRWTLKVSSLTPRCDYKAEFEVPVFRTPNSDRYFQPDLTVIQEFRAPPQSDSRFRRVGILIDELDGGGRRFVFLRSRHLVFALCLIFVQATFAAVFIALVGFNWPSASPHAAVIFGGLLLYAILDILCFRSEVEVASKGLSVRTGIFGLSSPREVDRKDIKQLFPKWAGSAGNTSGFDLYVETTTDNKLLFAKRIVPEQIAKEVIRLMNETLGK